MSSHPQPTPASEAPVSPPWHQREVFLVLALCAWLAVIFGMVWNPWWMPSGDAEVFIVAARNLYHGYGFVFNGAPVAIIPPGWPLVLAGLLHVTDQYLWLKAAQIVSMSAFLLLSYAILRHYVPARTAALACGLAAILWPLYPLTMWLHSDALFCMLSAAVGLACVRWGDGKLAAWWLVVILMGCGALVFVRWAALPQAIVVAGLICGSGRWRGARGRAWPHLAARHIAGAALIIVVTLGAFASIKAALARHATGEPAPSSAAAAAAAPAIHLAAIRLPEEAVAPELFSGREDSDIPLARELGSRVADIPRWFSWTLFAPLRVAGALYVGKIPAGLLVDVCVGLVAMAMIAVAAWRALRDGQRGPHYLWLGVLAYVIALGLNWPHVNNRYLVPIAPFMIAGILAGLGHLAHLRPFRALRWSFVVAVLAVNGMLWSVDALICRSRTAEAFYARWEAGIYLSLVEIGVYLDEQETGGGRIVASERYLNLNERWEYPLAPRALVMMTDRQVGSVPTLKTGAAVKKAQSWARETNVLFYVQQNQTTPGRIWHFRVSPQIEELITGWPPPPQRPQYELYKMKPDPIPKNPDLHSLQYEAVPVLSARELERATRRVPHIR